MGDAMATHRFFSASTGDEQHHLRPDSWVPTETVTSSARRQRTEKIFVFCTACIRVQERRRWKEEYRCVSNKLV